MPGAVRVGARAYRPAVPIMVPPDTVAQALHVFGIDPQTARPLDRGGAPDGLVLACRLGDEDAFCKLKPLPDEDTTGDLAREHAVVALAEHLRASVPVMRHLPSTSGALVELVTGHAVTVTARAPGRHVTPEEALAPGFARAWAGTLGRIHAATRTWVGDGDLNDWRGEHEQFVATCRDDEMGRLWAGLHARLAELPTEPDGFGVVHNDLHHGNLLLAEDGTLTVLDLDVAGRHWYATDLAILLVHPLWALGERADEARRFVTTAVEAYLAQYPLPPERLADVPLLAHYRMALFVLAMQNELGDASPPDWLRDLRAQLLAGRPLPFAAPLAELGR